MHFLKLAALAFAQDFLQLGVGLLLQLGQLLFLPIVQAGTLLQPCLHNLAWSRRPFRSEGKTSVRLDPIALLKGDQSFEFVDQILIERMELLALIVAGLEHILHEHWHDLAQPGRPERPAAPSAEAQVT